MTDDSWQNQLYFGDNLDISQGVVDGEKAAIGVNITLKPPAWAVCLEVSEARFYEPESLPGKKYPKIQILTITELLAGKKLEHLHLGIASFKKAPRQTKVPTRDKQKDLKEMMLPYTTN